MTKTFEYKIMKYNRYYQAGEITVQVVSDLPITDDTFHPNIRYFQVDEPGEDMISIHHHFFLPELDTWKRGHEICRKGRFLIYKNSNSRFYVVFDSEKHQNVSQLAIFNLNHTEAIIYSKNNEDFSKGCLPTLSFLFNDEILLAHTLADRNGCYFHSSGVTIDNKGFLFIGHSEAGKSTIAQMLKRHGKILCDERIILQKKKNKFRIYGTWKCREKPVEVSSGSAPLKAIMILKQAQDNHLTPLKDRKEVIKKLLPYIIRPFTTARWWNNIFAIVEELSREIPCYVLQFDKSGEVADLLNTLKV